MYKIYFLFVMLVLFSANLYACGEDALCEKDPLSFYENSGAIEVYKGRAYPVRNENFPWQLKCTTVDYRTIHGCLEVRFLEPTTRVYFDLGGDTDTKVDVFNNGNMNFAVDLAYVYLPWRLGRGEFYDKWSWGPVVGAGVSTSGKDSDDGSKSAPGAPIVIMSGGMMLEYKPKGEVSLGFEAGAALGISASESIDDNLDAAMYFGLKLAVPLGKKPNIGVE